MAFGKRFICNPHLPLRLRLETALSDYDHATSYGGGMKGYTDYPTLEIAIHTQVAEVEACR
ncbi:MAG: hypothetical protein DMG69_25175 [Acidobacteria bacterium]|nr:MAG: hypothetical protein DMG69_25175 [Acidobacteriota bacterium]